MVASYALITTGAASATQEGILAGLTVLDVEDLAAAFDEMRQARYQHPAEFVAACRRFQRLCRVLKIASIDFERISMWSNRSTFAEALKMVNYYQHPARSAA